ncbi:MAG: ABC transporter permease subunit [Lachnospiraceae bacterium]|nr:ABC transporter permease subunit [Lachnospiraceae bacterium]
MKLNKDTENVFKKRKITYTIVFVGVLIVYFIASTVTKFHLWDGLVSIPKAIVWMGEKLVPDAAAMAKLPKILKKLFETALLSVAVTVIAAIIAFFFSLLGSKTTKVNGIVNRLVRIVAAFFRNVPDVVWAMLLMFSFGQNILTGFFALFFTTFGLLTRAFIETIDEVSSSCVEALDATGATFIQTVFQGIIPASITEIITWVLYMIETNIRSSTLIGMLTATGIGYLFDLYYKRLDFASAGLIVISMVVLVITIEGVSNRIRKVIQ